MEYTSRISNKLRETESGFKEFLPPKLKGFIIKRQAKLTHDQAKHLHFYKPTRGPEADKMVDALNRLRRVRGTGECVVVVQIVVQVIHPRLFAEHHGTPVSEHHHGMISPRAGHVNCTRQLHPRCDGASDRQCADVVQEVPLIKSAEHHGTPVSEHHHGMTSPRAGRITRT